MPKTVFTGQVDSISTRADKSIKIVISTQEQTEESKVALFGLHQKPACFLISTQSITEQESEAVTAAKLDLAENGKSPSQRLRGVLFRLWQQDNKGYKDSNLYYLA